MLELGDLQASIHELLQPAYARRYHRMMKAIDDFLVPLGARPKRSDDKVVGGYFIWIILPKGVQASQVVATAQREENLIVAAGSIFEVPGSDVTFPHDLRICLAWEDEEKLSEGVERLGRVIRRLLEKGAKGEEGMQLQTERDQDLATAVDHW